MVIMTEIIYRGIGNESRAPYIRRKNRGQCYKCLIAPFRVSKGAVKKNTYRFFFWLALVSIEHNKVGLHF